MNLAGLKKENPLNALFERHENRQSSGKTPISTLLATNTSRNANLPEPDPNFEAGDISGLKTGDKVQHQRFGSGTVSAIEGEADNRKATVIFEGLGEKKLVLKFAKMRIVK
jgi:DNA helicase-2/ATP-dependent DNA helicase PcrA